MGPLGLTGPAHGPDVRQVAQSMEEPAAEVHGVGLHLVGRAAGGQGGHDRAEQRALAGPRRPDHRQVPGAPRKVQDQRLLCLFVRPVNDPDRHPEPARLRVPQQRTQGDLRGEWRKPHLMDRPAGSRQAADQVLEVGPAGVPRADPGGPVETRAAVKGTGEDASTLIRAEPGAAGRW